MWPQSSGKCPRWPQSHAWWLAIWSRSLQQIWIMSFPSDLLSFSGLDHSSSYDGRREWEQKLQGLSSPRLGTPMTLLLHFISQRRSQDQSGFKRLEIDPISWWEGWQGHIAKDKHTEIRKKIWPFFFCHLLYLPCQVIIGIFFKRIIPSIWFVTYSFSFLIN